MHGLAGIITAAYGGVENLRSISLFQTTRVVCRAQRQNIPPSSLPSLASQLDSPAKLMR